MSKGRSNKLVAQTGEFLVCAELGRRGLIATPFAGNVPAFDVLAADANCRTVPIQVKTTAGYSWPDEINSWMRVDFDESTGVQKPGDPTEIENPELIYVLVALANDATPRDRFFILTKRDLQAAVISSYRQWMDPRGWKRPRKPDSMRADYEISDVETYEDNWGLVEEALRTKGAE